MVPCTGTWALGIVASGDNATTDKVLRWRALSQRVGDAMIGPRIGDEGNFQYNATLEERMGGCAGDWPE